jgi:hypothetical protein
MARLETALKEAIINLVSSLTHATPQLKGILVSARADLIGLGDSEKLPAVLVSPMRPMNHCDLLTTTTSTLLEAMPRNEFTFIINDATFPISVIEAVTFSPAVEEQFQVDACARRFVICDSEIDSTNFNSLQNLLSGVEAVFQKSHQKSLILLSRQLCNVGLERLFLGLWGDSAVDATVTLSSAFAACSRVYLQSVSDLSLLSVDALDGLLSSESFSVDSEDALLQVLFQLRNPPLLRHTSGNL